MWQGLSAQEITITQHKVKLTFTIDTAGRPTYTVDYNGKALITPSHQGFVLATDSLFYKGFTIINTEKKATDETWKPVWGEVSAIRNNYEQLTVHLKQQSSGRLLDIVFRVFEDGVGFRYEFPYQSNLKYFTVTEERTQFNLPGDATAWWIPGIMIPMNIPIPLPA